MKKLFGMACVITVSGLAAMTTSAEEERKRDCLSMSHIDRIEVVDNQTLVFHMQGDKKYVNNLPYKCHGLKNNSFIHETSLQQYCDLDTITVFDAGIGMKMGACPLGEFEPYEEMEKPEE